MRTVIRRACLLPALALTSVLLANCGGSSARDPQGPDSGWPADAGDQVDSGEWDGGHDPRVGSIEVQPDGFCLDCRSLKVGQQREFLAMVFDLDGAPLEDEPVEWVSSDPSILGVQGNTATGLSPGTAKVLARAGGKEGAFEVEVLPEGIASIEVIPDRIVIRAGEEAAIQAIARTASGAVVESELLWITANPGVATVEPGKALGVGRGLTMLFVGSAVDPVEAAVVVEVQSDQPMIPGMLLENVSVGTASTCGVDPAGVAYCWGDNYWGQLGLGFRSGPEELFPTPMPVRFDLGEHSEQKVSTIWSKESHACALDLAGKAWCWGANSSGELGVSEDLKAVGGTTIPFAVLHQEPFSSLALGYDFTCALSLTQEAWCWGGNYDSALGLGDARKGEDKVPLPAKVVGGHQFKHLVAGLHSSCGLDIESRAWCWGDNSSGTVGSGEDPKVYADPTEVLGDHRFSAMDMSANHVCAIDLAGSAWCWGYNVDQQVGHETESSVFAPYRVAGGHVFTATATGAHHSCALDAGGEAWCWGNNGSGQLGDGTIQASAAPVKVRGGLRFGSLSAGNNTTCGRTADGEAWCWGAGYRGMNGAGFPMLFALEPWPVAVPEVGP